jgi:hypothetical protein
VELTQLCEDEIRKADDINENTARERDIVETDKPTKLLAFRQIDRRQLDQKQMIRCLLSHGGPSQNKLRCQLPNSARSTVPLDLEGPSIGGWQQV